MKWREKPRVRAHYVNQFLEDITGKDITAIKMMCKRKSLTYREYLKLYFEKYDKGDWQENIGKEGQDQ